MEKPIECSDCKKAITIHFKEIQFNKSLSWSFCENCPVYKKRIDGGLCSDFEETISLRSCPSCGCCSDVVRQNAKLGCSVCYEFFSDEITREIQENTWALDSDQLHKGKQLNESPQIHSSIQIVALNEALQEALDTEDYEQAASLRDQIQALKDNSYDS